MGEIAANIAPAKNVHTRNTMSVRIVRTCQGTDMYQRLWGWETKRENHLAAAERFRSHSRLR